jgi:hypothetical protein
MTDAEANWKKEYFIRWDNMVLNDEDWIRIGMDAYGLSRSQVTTSRMCGNKRWNVRVNGEIVTDIDKYEYKKMKELLEVVSTDQAVTFEQTQFQEEKEELRDPSYWLPVEGMNYAVSGKNYIRVFARRTLTSRQKPEGKFGEDDDKVGKIFTVIKRALAKKLALTDDVDNLNFRTGCEMTRVMESKKACPVTWKV